MKQKTAIEELLSLIPSGQDIMAYIADNQPDEKMLDEWLWERIWKDRDWIGKNREQIEEAFMAGVENFSLDDVNLYYQQKYGDEPIIKVVKCDTENTLRVEQIFNPGEKNWFNKSVYDKPEEDEK